MHGAGSLDAFHHQIFLHEEHDPHSIRPNLLVCFETPFGINQEAYLTIDSIFASLAHRMQEFITLSNIQSLEVGSGQLSDRGTLLDTFSDVTTLLIRSPFDGSFPTLAAVLLPEKHPCTSPT
jgi:hypothetical protein